MLQSNCMEADRMIFNVKFITTVAFETESVVSPNYRKGANSSEET